MAKRILLCDDEVHILRAAEIKLSRAGYDVQTADDGLEGWKIIQQNPPDLLVTDCQMPRMDGLELIAKVRENPATVDLPILMLSAKGYELAHGELSHKWGVLAVLSKPFSPRELAKRVEDVLGPGKEQPIPVEA